LREEDRVVALSPAACELLGQQKKAQLAEGLGKAVPVFATETGGKPHGDCLKAVLYTLKGRRSNGLPASKDKRAKARPATLADDVTIHDLRRTCATALRKRLGVPPHVVEAVLGHSAGRLEATYQVGGGPLSEQRDALQRWAELLDGILSAAPATESGTL
jgi:integrase